MEDKILKKLDKLIEVVEILDDKIRKIELYQGVLSGQLNIMKDQQSVMNRKLTELQEQSEQTQKDLEKLSKKVETMSKTLNEVQETVETHSGSLIEIENKIEWYGTMYGLNEDHIQRLQKRLGKVENSLDMDVDEKLIVPPLPVKPSKN